MDRNWTSIDTELINLLSVLLTLKKSKFDYIKELDYTLEDNICSSYENFNEEVRRFIENDSCVKIPLNQEQAHHFINFNMFFGAKGNRVKFAICGKSFTPKMFLGDNIINDKSIEYLNNHVKDIIDGINQSVGYIGSDMYIINSKEMYDLLMSYLDNDHFTLSIKFNIELFNQYPILIKLHQDYEYLKVNKVDECVISKIKETFKMSEYIIHYYGEKDLGLRSGPKMCIQVLYKAQHLVNLVDHLRDKTVIGKILDVEFKMDVFRKEIVNGNLLVTYCPGYNPSGSTNWFNDVLDIIDIAKEPLISITPICATGEMKRGPTLLY